MLAFFWAYHKLSPDSQAFFRVLSLHLAPGFTLHTAYDLLRTSSDATLRHLEILIAAGLAERSDNDSYRIRDLLGGLAAVLPRQRAGHAQCQYCAARW